MNVIATDLDRTLIPNGDFKEDKKSMNEFKELLKKNKILLIYVTGRPLYLVEDAMKRYKLPVPSYVISMVGSKIYEIKKGKFIEMNSWNELLHKKCKRFDNSEIRNALKNIKGIKMQTEAFQNEFKVSYNLSDKRNVSLIKDELAKLRITYNLIESYDTQRKLYMIDILHRGVSKRFALFFILKKLGVRNKDVLYSGDSGNDIDLILSGKNYGVLVGNATGQVKKEVSLGIKKKNLREKVYIASRNYVLGIIEGAQKFGFFD